MLYAFAVAALLITLAELGDKTQLLALGLACKYPPMQVLIGIFIATLVVHFFSTLVGGFIGNLIPRLWLGIGSGILFIGFGIWTLRGDKADAEEATARSAYGPILTTAIAFFLAELGDKTQIMTMTVAADPAAVLRTLGSAGPVITHALETIGLSAVNLSRTAVFWGVWIGSTVGMMIADGIAIIVGAILGKKLPEKTITRVSGTIFILFGLASIGAALLG